MAPDEHTTRRSTHGRAGFLRSVGWAFTMDGGGQVLTLVISFALAALLGPRTYGVVAMAMVYVAFVQMVQRQGMASAIIQRKDLSGRHLDTAFWLVLTISGVLTAASVAFAGWWAGVNDLPELRPIIMALSALVVVEALTTVQRALLTRHMNFRALAARSLIGVSAGGVIGIVGALIGWGAWAIVAQQLTTSVVSLAVLWAVSGWRPRFRFSSRCARDLLGFSTGSFLSSIAVFANNRADVLLIGIFFGPFVVGIYQLASRLIDMIVTIASRPVQTVALPELSPHQDEHDEFARRLRRLMRVSAIAALPVLGVLAGVAEPLVGLLGSEWNSTVAVLQVLCLVGLIRVVIVLDGPLVQALGRPFVQAGITWLAAAVSVGTFTAAGLLLQDMPEDRQALWVSVSRAAIYGVLITGIHLVIISRFTSLSLRSGVGAYFPSFVAGSVGAISGWFTAALITASSPLLGLAVAGALSATIAAGTLLLLEPDLRAMTRSALHKIKNHSNRRHQSHIVDPLDPMVETDDDDADRTIKIKQNVSGS
ncbi:lipopolysaccharide biosynthesis protein [Phytoactinopolyspora alkaliphila]|uniref:Lipopolysaccharide biosynthesis protein n=1 Tax=Phytoactinopolyspora alkaliphila TaxID=1783498 RepID=A0A6N9YJB0_9ACTN|nr:lipopolysaccharide biosynthesis protein [Phytoactinopolyspora alkaliphila]NED95096.1 lipopolysaccharide biosynthesis protein [Phytoactinopolyspora alkaliphila]